MNNRHSVDHVNKFKMASQKRIIHIYYFSTSVSKPTFERVSNAIDLINSSDGIDEEEDATEILRDILSNSHPASSRENEHINNMSGDATDQSNCSSDGESIDSDVDKDVSSQVNMSVS